MSEKDTNTQKGSARRGKEEQAIRRIAVVVAETCAVKGDAATIRDDEAMMKLRDILDEAKGGRVITSDKATDRERVNRPVALSLSMTGYAQDNAPQSTYEVAERCLFYVAAMTWLLQQASPSHLKGENAEDVAAMLNNYGELAFLLSAELGAHVERLEAERLRLESFYAAKGGAA